MLVMEFPVKSMSDLEKLSHQVKWQYFEKLAANGLFRLILASDRENGSVIGYIVSSLSAEHTGEIESVFVTERYRGIGVGSVLVTMALAWLDEHGSVRNRVSVADGNEEVWAFYRKFDFYPRLTVLEQKKGSCRGLVRDQDRISHSENERFD